jgi:hypothetical protein
MSVIGLIGAGVGLASSLYGAHKSASEAKKQEAELARQRAANEAWYNRNYYQDYLNTVQAQNALKQYRNAWAERTKEARARQAISGGTAEQAQAVAEAGGEAMGNMIGNLAAKGQQDRTAIDAQKLAMDNNLSQQQAAIAEARQQAASNLMSSGASVLTSGLQAMDGVKLNAKEALGHQGIPVYPEGVKPLGDIATPVNLKLKKIAYDNSYTYGNPLIISDSVANLKAAFEEAGKTLKEGDIFRWRGKNYLFDK